MDPLTIGTVLLAIVGGAGGQLGAQLWSEVASLVRRPFHGKASGAAGVSSAEAEAVALQRAPADQHKAMALAEALLARSDSDEQFRQALKSWWQQAGPIRESIGGVTNTISGGAQHGPVLQGRDFSNVTFGAASASLPVQPS